MEFFRFNTFGTVIVNLLEKFKYIAITMIMNKYLLIILSVLSMQYSLAQEEPAFESGEWFRFKMSYSGFLKAGNATLTVKDNTFNGKQVYHVVGKGWTTGAIKWFFKVKDRYESFFDKSTTIPYKFIRDIDEGGHTRNEEVEFDQINNKAYINNIKYNRRSVLDTEPNIHDMVSTFYYFRNKINADTITKGDELQVSMYLSGENYGFKLKYLGEELIKTDFGKVKTLKFRPYVMAGRIFKEEESLTLWVSNDKNKIPLRIKANLAVGSLRADLDAFKGLKHPFKIHIDN